MMNFYVIRGTNDNKKWMEYAPFETAEDAIEFGVLHMKNYKRLEVITGSGKFVKTIR